MRLSLAVAATCLALSGCDTTASPTTPSSVSTTVRSSITCGHRLDPAIVLFGKNVVVSDTGQIQVAQGKPLQEGWRLDTATTEVTAHNDREYARIASYIMPIRDALMCDLVSTTLSVWQELTTILRLNNVKVSQDLSGTPKDQVYSNDGIFEHLKTRGTDSHPMMKYLEEAELELKCLTFTGFDFTNPEGENHCLIHNIPQGVGLRLP